MDGTLDAHTMPLDTVCAANDIDSISPGLCRLDYRDHAELYEAIAHSTPATCELTTLGTGCDEKTSDDRGCSDQATEHTLTQQHNLRTRINRRPVREKVRQKRQALQTMVRPLKRWLCNNQEHPYPTRMEKVILAREAAMSIVQVSNWFANARRRLKNTVRGDELSWSRRIRLYNSYVCGNQELLSNISEDSDIADTHNIAAANISDEWNSIGAESKDLHPDIPVDYSLSMIGPPKYKHAILQRYLTDSCSQWDELSATEDGMPRHRNLSGSLSSQDYEEISCSSRSTPTRHQQLSEENFDQYTSISDRPCTENSVNAGLCWKEISAALALTTLAKSRVGFSLVR